MLQLIRDSWWISLLPVGALLMVLHRFERLSPSGRRWLFACASILAAAGVAAQALVVRRNLLEPPQFDFWLYWAYGRAVTLGLDPYDHAVLRGLLEPLGPSPDLLAELYLFYPPPSLFLFAPLGWFSMKPALVLWTVIQGIALIGSIALLAKLFLSEYGRSGFAVSAALVLFFRAVGQTFNVCQVNILLLLLLLLFWRENSRARGGVWLALGAVIKPVIGVFGAFLLLRRKGRALAGMSAALAAASLLTIAVFGWTLFIRYFTANPVVKHMPAYLYTEDINQSLLATILRWTSADPSRSSPYAHPLFLGIASVLALASAFLVWRRRTEEDDGSLALMSVLGLLLFPKTLAHYAVLMLPGLFHAWRIRLRMPGGPWGAGVFILAVFGLVGAKQAFWAFALGWTVFAAVMVRDHLRTRVASEPAVSSA